MRTRDQSRRPDWPRPTALSVAPGCRDAELHHTELHRLTARFQPATAAETRAERKEQLRKRYTYATSSSRSDRSCWRSVHGGRRVLSRELVARHIDLDLSPYKSLSNSSSVSQRGRRSRRRGGGRAHQTALERVSGSDRGSNWRSRIRSRPVDVGLCRRNGAALRLTGARSTAGRPVSGPRSFSGQPTTRRADAAPLIGTTIVGSRRQLDLPARSRHDARRRDLEIASEVTPCLPEIVLAISPTRSHDYRGRRRSRSSS